jgi:hypothetical protein
VKKTATHDLLHHQACFQLSNYCLASAFSRRA